MVVGVGSEIPERTQPWRFRKKFNVKRPFAIYIGRIDENKGCKELFSHFERYAAMYPHGLDLVLVGSSVLPIPKHPRIRHLGFLSDEDKFDALAAADLLIMPSKFESLSMVALEAWALGKPVLANGHCDVLRGQCVRSNGGLYYDNFEEFAEALYLLEATGPLGGVLGRNGREFFRRHYTWPVIERKYLEMFDRLKREPAPRHGAAAGLVRARRKRNLPAARARSSTPCRRPVVTRCRTGRRSTPRVHQILATLGYGDAIGNEVLGINRALRAAGFDSEIIVETADPRLEDLTVDYRDMVGRDRRRRSADPPFLARLARVAHGVRAAVPDGAHVPQHHAAGVFPRRARAARAPVLSRPP